MNKNVVYDKPFLSTLELLKNRCFKTLYKIFQFARGFFRTYI